MKFEAFEGRVFEGRVFEAEAEKLLSFRSTTVGPDGAIVGSDQNSLQGYRLRSRCANGDA